MTPLLVTVVLRRLPARGLRFGARLTAGVASAGLLAALVAAPGTAAPARRRAGPDPAPGVRPVAVVATAGPRAVVEVRRVGRSVRHRPFYAWRVGEPHAPTTAVVIAGLHGDERAGRRMLRALRDGPRVHGVDLWLLPNVNPDGFRRHTRENARGVDLNRNFPRRWRATSASGDRPTSEPETRALMRFFVRVRPRLVVSLHQPLHGVDTYAAKRWWFVRRLARTMHLPLRRLDCTRGCHGTFTQWFNRRLPGAAVTVELGPRPTWRRLHVTGPRGLLRAVGGSR